MQVHGDVLRCLRVRVDGLLQAAKRLLKENNTPTALVVGRYVSTYNYILKRSWWDATLSGGTIVEQVNALLQAYARDLTVLVVNI